MNTCCECGVFVNLNEHICSECFSRVLNSSEYEPPLAIIKECVICNKDTNNANNSLCNGCENEIKNTFKV